MNRSALAISLALSLALSVPAFRLLAQMGLIEKDKPFPTFTFPTLEGQPKSVADFRGQKVFLINFASW